MHGTVKAKEASSPNFNKEGKTLDIIILSKTLLDEVESVYLKGFDVVRKERNNIAGGGGTIFINNLLKYSHKDGVVCGRDGKTEVCATNYIMAKIKY
jgi:ribose 5-phosphate isomerase